MRKAAADGRREKEEEEKRRRRPTHLSRLTEQQSERRFFILSLASCLQEGNAAVAAAGESESAMWRNVVQIVENMVVQLLHPMFINC